ISQINRPLATSPNGSIDISNSTHLQLTSATPCTVDIIPQAKTHPKTAGPSTARRHHHLNTDDVIDELVADQMQKKKKYSIDYKLFVMLLA
uniref:Uncharacterized protein n=1 Tax=Romanomermis culicivorax TaxID=13658 RepID=A0A915KCI3_ROMCU